MPDAPESRSFASAPTQQPVLRLAVFHRSEDVQEHIAPLRQVKGLELLLVWQGVTWMLPRERRRRALGAVAGRRVPIRASANSSRGVPAASYSLASNPALVELSRAIGFQRHLSTPVRLVDVERALGLPAVIELADRLEAATPRLAAPVAPHRSGQRADARRQRVDRSRRRRAGARRRAPANGCRSTEWSRDGGRAGRHRAPARRAGARPAGADAGTRDCRDRRRAAARPRSGRRRYVTDRLAVGGDRDGRAEVTVLGWPLVAGGEVAGVLVGVDHGRLRRLPSLPPELGDALALLVEPAAFALAHALRVARAEALSVTDDLTQLYNSRYLNDALRKETKRAMRGGWPLSLLFVDLDGFKQINDVHGHLLGSRALIEAAQIIRSCARETDVVARFGGDEFAILLPETGLEGGHAVARRLRDRLQRHVFLADHGPGNRISASIGLATLPDVADTAEGLLQAADAAMYRVKVSGKNGIHVAGQ